MRAKSVAHAEYEIISHFWKVNLFELKSEMAQEGDVIADKRFRKATENINGYLKNMKDRRRHKLPKEHVEFRGKNE